MANSKELKLEEAIKSYEKAIENKGSGFLIVAAFTSICKWLRYEKEFDDIETWRKARSLCWSIMRDPDTYNLNLELLQEANYTGISLAKTYFESGEIEKGYTFRSFIKKLNVFNLLNSEETGDLILCLLILRVAVGNNENDIITNKYVEDLESICNDQLEGEKIYNDTLNMATKIFNEYEIALIKE